MQKVIMRKLICDPGVRMTARITFSRKKREKDKTPSLVEHRTRSNAVASIPRSTNVALGR